METEEIRIEKNITIPDARGGCAKYPIKIMGIGDSFFVKADNTKKARSIQSTLGAITSKKRVGDKEFTTRTIKSPLGVRIWRVKK